MTELMKQARAVKDSATTLAICSTQQKNEVLQAVAKALITRSEEILAANKIDITRGTEQGLSPALLDRLTLTAERIRCSAGDGTT